MAQTITLAVIQMQMTKSKAENMSHARDLVCKASREGANVVLLPELFATPYFCQERQYEYYNLAQSLTESDEVKEFSQLARELNIALPISFYERDGMNFYNSIAFADGQNGVLGVYRKVHIPDDHFYQEKFYFTPGNLGFKVWKSQFANFGVGICWDQWFPEAARIMALNGADLLLYPTAIGSEPILDTDSSNMWRLAMQGHAATNMTPVAAANRFGTELVTPSEANGQQSSSLYFYGTSFITDETGEIVEQAGRTEENILLHSFNLEQIREKRLSWGYFRDRRPECYGEIASSLPHKISTISSK